MFTDNNRHAVLELPQEKFMVLLKQQDHELCKVCGPVVKLMVPRLKWINKEYMQMICGKNHPLCTFLLTEATGRKALLSCICTQLNIFVH